MNKCNGLTNLSHSSECGNARPKASFSVQQDNIGQIKVFNQKGTDVTEYFNVSVVDGVVVMNYKKDPTFEEWRKIAGKL